MIASLADNCGSSMVTRSDIDLQAASRAMIRWMREVGTIADQMPNDEKEQVIRVKGRGLMSLYVTWAACGNPQSLISPALRPLSEGHAMCQTCDCRFPLRTTQRVLNGGQERIRPARRNRQNVLLQSYA